jgi:poly(3-hydroxybutyrate) depolymerase
MIPFSTRPSTLFWVPIVMMIASSFICFAQMNPGTPPRSNQELAGKAELLIDPVCTWRYTQGTGPYPAPTQTLTGRRRAFYPGEELTLRFQVPGSPVSPLPYSAAALIELFDINGKQMQEIGKLTLGEKPLSNPVAWKVAQVPEGEYFLAVHFSDTAGKALTTRSEVIFIAPEFPQLRSAAEKAVQEASSKIPNSNGLLRKISLPSVEMMLEDALMRWDDFGDAQRDWAFVKNTLLKVKQHSATLTAGKDPFASQTGVFVKGYRSELDETLQPYALYVPRNYNPKRTYPLLISLHGATSNHLLNIRRVFGLGNRPGESDYEAIRNQVVFPEVDFIVVSPYGRGEIAGYNGVGEQDVLQVLSDVEKTYHVDPNRVYLTGLSMGGGGTWHLGLRYPDRWAAIVPVCAVADPSNFGRRGGTADADRKIFELTSALPLAENAGNMSIFMYHGDMDNAVAVEQSRKMTEAYDKVGWMDKNVHYYELPGVTHFAWDFSYRHGNIFKLLAPVQRNPFPRRVIYTTFSPRYNQSYWLRIDRMERGLELARIEGEWEGSLFKIKTGNISAFSLLFKPGMLSKAGNIKVQWEGETIYEGAAPAESLSFSKTESGHFSLQKSPSKTGGIPDHAEGSFRARSLAQYSRHLYIYGSSGDAETVQTSKELAEKLANWGPGVKVQWKVKADREVTDEEKKNGNLVLVGNPMSNSLIGEVEKQLPLKQTPEGIQAGSIRVEGKNCAYRLIYPSPYAEGKYILVYGAMTPQGVRRLRQSVESPYSPNQTADYLIYGEKESTPKAGLFKDSWQLLE